MKMNGLYSALIGAGLWLVPVTSSAAKLSDDANTTCPIMLEEDVDPDIFVEHEGEKIYLCCTKCKREFRKDPEKYMARIKESRKTSSKAGKKPAGKDKTTTRPL